jgi:hypothetical protein
MDINEDVTQETEGALAPLHKVTPLSKYLAMVLFVLLPFVGGWIGYTYAPEKVVEVERVVEVIVSTKVLEEENDELNFESFLSELSEKLQTKTNSSYQIIDSEVLFWKQIFNDVDAELYSGMTNGSLYFKLLDDTHYLLTLNNLAIDHFYLFSIDKMRVVRSLEGERANPYRGPTAFFFAPGIDRYIEVAVTDKQVILLDYVAEKKYILYNEPELDVTLLEYCELRCEGLLSFRSNNDIIVGRYDVGQPDAEYGSHRPKDFINSIVVNLPEGWN